MADSADQTELERRVRHSWIADGLNGALAPRTGSQPTRVRGTQQRSRRSSDA
jgi:hypothetical protein